MRHEDEGATQSEVLRLSNKGVSCRFDGYARKAIGMTPGDPPSGGGQQMAYEMGSQAKLLRHSKSERRRNR